jgi:hypothetical protein
VGVQPVAVHPLDRRRWGSLSSGILRSDTDLAAIPSGEDSQRLVEDVDRQAAEAGGSKS